MEPFEPTVGVDITTPYVGMGLSVGGGAPLQTRLFEATAARAGILFMGDTRGGFDSPTPGLYRRLGIELASEGATGLWLQYRTPGDVVACIEDVMLGAHYLRESGAIRIGLVGHGFGASVAVQAALHLSETRSVVAIVPSGSGFEAQKVDELVAGKIDWRTGGLAKLHVIESVTPDPMEAAQKLLAHDLQLRLV